MVSARLERGERCAAPRLEALREEVHCFVTHVTHCGMRSEDEQQ